jgi:hypothetical protein
VSNALSVAPRVPQKAQTRECRAWRAGTERRKHRGAKGEIIGNRSNADRTETASVWRGSGFEPLTRTFVWHPNGNRRLIEPPPAVPDAGPSRMNHYLLTPVR